MTIRPRLCVLLLLVSLWPGTLLAGHYDLVDIDHIGKPERERLIALGITNTLQLLNRTAKRKDRRQIARKAGIPLKTLDRWTRFCDMLRINGVGPKMSLLFQASGVPDVKKLRRQDPEILFQKMRVANQREGISELLPSTGHLRHWIDQARKLPIIVE